MSTRRKIYIYVTYSGRYRTQRRKRKKKYHCAKTKATKNAIREIKYGMCDILFLEDGVYMKF